MADRAMAVPDGSTDEALAAELGLPRVHVFDVVASTQDLAHEMAASGAPPGTLVVADAQTEGRGRMGRHWRSEPGMGVWFTVIERPVDAVAAELVSIRAGLLISRALSVFAPVRVKWPNDLILGDRKLGGILVEARWRETRLEWLAVGVGINTRPPAGSGDAIGLAGCSRQEVLRAAVPAVRAAARSSGWLSSDELAEFEARDWASGRHCVAPVRGRVFGIDRTGALLVSADGEIITVRSGSLVLEDR